MALTPGARLGPYEVVAAIGAGGMGEVYRARDTRLGRDVALKVLPARVTRDRASRERFEREAKSISALNHPNICTLYDVGREGDIDFLVMEFVDGEDLSTVIRRGRRAAGAEAPALHQAERSPRADSKWSPRADSKWSPRADSKWSPGADSKWSPGASAPGSRRSEWSPRADSKWSPGASAPGSPVDEALAIARQIALALEAAHERGIVHRDLKPANIKITPDGTVKVLDFGLAKALGFPGAEAPGLHREAPGLHSDAAGLHPDDAANSPTFTALAPTQAGVILGTAAYMSPEQARGRVVDKRTDIWAFGCVLYEMLTGRRPFGGVSRSDRRADAKSPDEGEDTVTDLLAAIVTQPPDWTALPAATPASVRRLLRRCLEKDRRQRLADIGDARLEIDDAAEPAGDSATPVSGPSSRLPWLMAAAGVLTAAVGLWYGLGAQPPEPGWVGSRLATPSIAFCPRVSPNGEWVAFIAMEDRQTQVAVMKPETGESMILTQDRSRGLVNHISWSRDGTKIYFDRFENAPRGIFSVSFPGRDEQPVLDDAINPEVVHDGSLMVQKLVGGQYRLHRYWPQTGALKAFDVILAPSTDFAAIRSVPGQDRVVFFGRPVDNAASVNHLYALDLNSERLTRLTTDETPPPIAPFAVTPDGSAALVSLPVEDTYRVVRVPLDGRAGPKTLMSFPVMVFALDTGTDGSIYLDQFERPLEILRLSPPRNAAELIATVRVNFQNNDSLPLPDGRVLANGGTGARQRLILITPGRGSVPFIGDAQEPTTGPMTLVGDTHVAFMLGPRGAQIVAMASLANRRITARFTETRGMSIGSLAASRDGATIYAAASGSIWAIPAQGGSPQEVHRGHAVALDHARNDLVIRIDDADGSRLVRWSPGGGDAQPIPVQAPTRIAPSGLLSNAISPDGRIVAQVTTPDNWHWPAGVVHPRTGAVEVIGVGYDADMIGGWAPDGSLVFNAVSLRSSLWRFRPEERR